MIENERIVGAAAAASRGGGVGPARFGYLTCLQFDNGDVARSILSVMHHEEKLFRFGNVPPNGHVLVLRS